jgi:hypothetical protein
MDEYQVEMNDLRHRIARLKLDRASAVLIEELEAQLRILKAIYDSTSALFAAGEGDGRLQASFHELELGNWTFENVYFYVYEEAVALDAEGRDLASRIMGHDYGASLRSGTPQSAAAGG